jgi:hypothetical protein
VLWSPRRLKNALIPHTFSVLLVMVHPVRTQETALMRTVTCSLSGSPGHMLWRLCNHQAASVCMNHVEANVQEKGDEFEEE